MQLTIYNMQGNYHITTITTTTTTTTTTITITTTTTTTTKNSAYYKPCW
jgi:hypothetical protein